MCVVLFAWRSAPDHRLLLIGNRDEFHGRPTAGLGWWPGASLLAGRDLEAGGTWMGLTRSGRFALVTNVREPEREAPSAALSRGLLVAAFLSGTEGARDAAAALADGEDRYAGYNLILCDREDLVVHSNRYGTQLLEPGVYGLSNAELDADWPKVRRGRAGLSGSLEADDARLLELLADADPAPEADLPDTGVGLEWERRLSATFIRSSAYGTRASSVVRLREDGYAAYTERRFDEDGRSLGTHTESITTR